MKKTILALTAAGLLAGCSKSPSPAAPAAEQKPMHPAVSQLDLDGDLVLFLNTSTVEKRILDYIDQVSSMILGAAGSSAPGPEFQAVTDGIGKVKTAIEWSGLLSLDSYATSIAPVEGTLCRTISIASYSEADANKPLWRLLAAEPKVLEGIRYAPADAVYTVNGTASLDDAWKIANEAIATFLEPAQVATFNQQMAMVEMMLGTNITAITGSLDSEILVSIQLSEQRQCQLPMGAQVVGIPEPNLIIGLQTKSPLVGQIILQKLQQSGMPLVDSPHGTNTLHTLNLPMPAPFPVSPTLVQTEDYLLIGSSADAIANALDSKANGTGLTATPLYKKLLADAPEKTSSLEFLSPRFMQAYVAVMKQSMNSMPSSEASAMMDMMLGSYENICSGSYSLKTPTGLYSKCYADYGGAKPVEMAAAGYIGVLASIGIPSFEKARSNSQEKMCMNNRRILDAATEEWAMQNNKQDGDLVDEAGIGEYIKGGLSALQCPKGGTYTIGLVGTSPSCSVHEASSY